jgi:parallel beta-helix repeat protein
MRKMAVVILLGSIPFELLMGEAFAQRPDVEKVRKRVREKGYTFEVGENPATRYTLQQLCGTKLPRVRRPRLKAAPKSSRRLPEWFDWRQVDGCTPVKNQGGCGSCWAFAAVGAVESAYLIRTGRVFDFSEQWLVSCTNAGSCNGGWYETAFDYMLSLEDACHALGTPTEDAYPYEERDADCACPEGERYVVSDWSSVDSNIDAMKQAIMDYGPIAVSVCSDDLFQCYTGGIFNADTNDPINHAVVLVGWDDTQGAAGVWFLKNSWGPGWGENGYMRIEYGRNRVGTAPCRVEVVTPDDPNILEVPAVYPTIAAAVAAAAQRDIIVLAPGVYTGEGNVNIDPAGKPLTIRSVNPGDPNTVAATIIDCGGTPETPARAFSFVSGEGADTMISGLTIRNGYTRENGGAIYCYYSSPTIRNCVFENNTATGYKKAGGAIALYNSSPRIERCRIAGNTASSCGGGVSCRDSSRPVITHCEITDNIAGNEGGGVYCWVNSSAALDHNVIAGNHANDAGGGIYLYECTSGPTDANVPVVEFCTIADNTTNGIGGGLFAMDSIAVLHNSILWNNFCGELEGHEIAMLDDSLHGTRVEAAYCDVAGLDRGHLVGGFCTLDWKEGNLDVDPLFADAAGRDYHLKSAAGRWDPSRRDWVLDDGDNYDPADDENSPAIDAADPSSDFGAEYECNGGRANLGAYGGTAQAGRSYGARCCMQCIKGDFNCDCLINLDDLAVLIEQWLACNLLPRHHCAE